MKNHLIFLFVPVTVTLALTRSTSQKYGVCRNIYRNRIQHSRIDMVTSRRHFLPSIFLASVLASSPSAMAFDNAIPEAVKFADRPKRKGPKPTDLGLQMRDVNQYGDQSNGPVLKGCKTSPNCFSTSGDPEFDGASLITNWHAPKGRSFQDSVTDLDQVLRGYQPGQQGVDGGGFSIVTVKPSGYFYAQFEALKNGYVDDLEFALTPGEGGDGDVLELQVRSSSRVGFLDAGVNAKRLNFLALQLRAKGWDVLEITRKSHPDYFIQNYGPSSL